MIILINGPFGVGKTSVATLLNESLEDYIIFDPEEVGGMLRNIVTEDILYPKEKTDDFQDIILWKELTVLIAAKLMATYNTNLIIPMTIYKLEYFNYIISELRKIDCQVYHFCLLAQRQTIIDRLLERGEKIGSWPFEQIDKCLYSYENNMGMFGKIIFTDCLSVKDITAAILNTVLE
ncbi:MAG: AAA family ATPase [Clostridiales bacterium]|nr:AAA family ATPase [Clostridiales bacterium]